MVDRQRAYEAFVAVLERPAARDELLSTYCGEDEELRQEVLALLAVAQGDSLATRAMLAAPTAEAPCLVGRQFGHYRLLEQIGQGGMGVVYRAERIDEVPQVVAIKILLGELTGVDYLRFQREARILARLEHPAIARLIDAGVQEGQAWIALEYVQGQPIDAYCDQRGLSIRERVKLLSAVADAIASAHRLLVVHRDIKPGNVIVTNEGAPKLLDFGIGTTLSATGEPYAPTVSANRLFTPHFSAPEQVTGDPATVATDVFGLGALAYRLLSGCLPFAKSGGPLRYMLDVTQHEVELPSVAARHAGKDERIVAALRGDLDAILYKAMSRTPAERYGSAADLRADFERYLRTEPVIARRHSVGYRLQKLVQRRTRTVIAAGLLLVGAMVAAALYGHQARNVDEARKVAAERGQFLTRLLSSANPSVGRRDVLVADLLDKALSQTDQEISVDPLVAASILGVIARSEKGLGRLDQALQANDRELALLNRYGASREDRIDALNLRSLVLYESGHVAEAEAPTRETLRLLDYQCKADGAYADTLDILGEILSFRQSDDGAEAIFQQELACSQKIHSALRTVHALNNIILLDKSRDRADAAVSAGRQAVELGHRSLAPDAPFLLTTELNLADAMTIDHQAVEAEPLIRQVLATRTRVLGPTHIETLMTGTYLANNLSAQHRYTEAAATALATGNALERQVGAEHFLTANAWQAYGIAACHAGQIDAGLQALQKALQHRAKRFGADSWQSRVTQTYIGICFALQRHTEQAEASLVPAVNALAMSRGEGFYVVQDGCAVLRDLYEAQGKAQQAAAWAARIHAAPPVG